jgi:ABC-type uncharacterized transport system ATPase subunit
MTVYVDNLVKYYRVHHKEPGLRGSLRSLFRRQYETVKAVDGISFDIEQGEIVGFLEPNLSRLSGYVRMGTLDYILTKPLTANS